MLSRIHGLLVEQPMTIREIADVFEVSYKTASAHVLVLCNKGIVEHKGQGLYGVVTNSERDLKTLLNFVQDDAIAASYQSLGQYRNEIIKMIASILESENNG